MSTAPSEALMPLDTKKKKVKKPTAKAVANLTTDPLISMSHDVETMSKAQAFSAIPELLEHANYHFIRVGGVLAVVRDNEWWQEEGYESFKALIEKKFGLKYRKAAYWVQIYTDLIDSGVEWGQVSTMGWCKLKEVSPVLTKENAAEWVAKAEGLTVLQLHEVVKLALAQAEGTLETSGVSPEGVETTTTTMSFKVHVDQKETIRMALDKAKLDAKTEFDAVALEGICMNYLAGGKVTKKLKKTALKDMLSQYKLTEVLKVIAEVWPGEINVEVD